MTQTHPLRLIAAGAATGAVIGLAGAGAMALLLHRLSLAALRQQLAEQRAAFERQLDQERAFFAAELQAGRDLLERQLTAQRQELLLDRLAHNPTEEQRHEIMKIQWAHDLARGVHLQPPDQPSPLDSPEA